MLAHCLCVACYLSEIPFEEVFLFYDFEPISDFEMSLMGEMNTDLYRQMADLQEKLKQSEAQRSRLENMFGILLKTFKEEEEIKLNNLESRYQSFLEDCTRRSYRNEKILRSLERVESGANVLYAKTERLKLLRNHYEAYLERVIPDWKTTSVFRHGANPIFREMEWSGRNHVNADIMERSNSAFQPTVLIPRSTSFNYVVSPGCEVELENQHFQNPFSKSCKNMWRQTDRDRAFDYAMERPLVDSRVHLQHKNEEVPIRRKFLDFHEQEIYCGTQKTPDNQSRFQLNLEKSPSNETDVYKPVSNLEPTVDNFSSILTENFRESQASDVRHPSVLYNQNINLLSKHKEISSNNADNSGNKSINERPLLTHEPLQINKPEFIVGKLNPRTASEFEFFSKVEVPVQDPHLSKPLMDEDKNLTVRESNGCDDVNNEIKQSQTDTPKQFNVKQKVEESIIHDMKDSLYDAVTQETGILKKYIHPQEKECVEKEDTEKTIGSGEMNETLNFTGSWQTGIEQGIEKFTLGNDSPNNSESHGVTKRNLEEVHDIRSEVHDYEDLASNGCDLEDNEEYYPDSYYEQPKKPDYTRNIVSNVILEEDESELNVNEANLERTNSKMSPTEANDQSIEENIPEGQTLQQAPEQVSNGLMNQYLKNSDEVENTDNQFHNSKLDYGNSNYEHGNILTEQYHDDLSNIYGDRTSDDAYDQQNIYSQQQYISGVNPENGGLIAAGHEQGFMYNENQNFGNNITSEGYNSTLYQEQLIQEQGISHDNYYNEQESNIFYDGQLPQNNELIQPEGNSHISEMVNEHEQFVPYADESNNLPLRQKTLAHLLESDSESFQMEHGSGIGNEDSDFDFSLSQQQ